MPDADPAATRRHYARLADLAALVGQELGTSPWQRIEQPRVDGFADATGDHQWIHVDPARAAAGPFGAPIAHGFLTLSLLPMLSEQAFAVDDVRMGVNYGLNRVRFPAPVRVGSRVRGRFVLRAFDPLDDGGVQLLIESTIELEGSAKPACVAESVTRRYA